MFWSYSSKDVITVLMNRARYNKCDKVRRKPLSTIKDNDDGVPRLKDLKYLLKYVCMSYVYRYWF